MYGEVWCYGISLDTTLLGLLCKHDDRVYGERMSDAKVQTANKSTWENEVGDSGKESITS